MNQRQKELQAILAQADRRNGRRRRDLLPWLLAFALAVAVVALA